MVTSISVVAQHKAGLDLLINNLRWAIDRPHKIVIFTFLKHHFPKEKYPDVEFIEVDQDPEKYHHFHGNEVEAYIKKCQSDVIVFTELDTLFTEKIGDLIDEVRITGKVHVGIVHGWYSLSIDGKVVYPRIWEGGLIIKSKYMLDCFYHGLNMSQKPHELGLKHIFTSYNLKYRIGDKDCELGEKCQNMTILGDNFAALQLYCFVKNIECNQHKKISHIKGPETIQRSRKHLYENLEYKYEELIKADYHRGAGTVFHLFILGMISTIAFDACIKVIRGSWRNEINSLFQNARHWMPIDIYKRYLYAFNKINSDKIL